MAGTVLTNKGLNLITKLVAAKATLSFTRVAVGTGSVPSGADPQNMIELNSYKMDATIESYGVSADQADVAYVTAQVSSVGVDSGFAVTETGVFATDPDEGEILYAYLDLANDPQYIYAETDAISKFAEITLNVLIGSVESVTAIISPGALVKKADFDALEERVSNIEIPEFDDSGSVSGITNFTEFLATLVSGMNFFNFFRNLKAGFQFVLHVGQLVSNTSTNNANLPASAAAVYQNAQAIASLNTEIITLEVETDQYSQINFLKSKVHGTLISAWNDQYLLVRQEMDGPSYYFRVFGLLTEKKLNPADAGITFTVRILSLVLPG